MPKKSQPRSVSQTGNVDQKENSGKLDKPAKHPAHQKPIAQSVASSDDLKKEESENLREKPNEHRKFKSRSIENNWAKYDEEPVLEGKQISDAELKNTGADFRSLISQSGTDTSVFKFKNEADWELKDYKKNTEDVPEDTLLSINLEKISNSLTHIPIYEKLGFSTTLETLNEDGFNWHGDYLEKIKSEDSEYAIPKSDETAGINNSSDWCFKSVEKYEKTVSSCLSRLQNNANEIELTDYNAKESTEPHQIIPENYPSKDIADESKKQDNIEDLLDLDIPIIDTKPSASSFEGNKAMHPILLPADNEEDELDFLLSM